MTRRVAFDLVALDKKLLKEAFKLILAVQETTRKNYGPLMVM